MVVRRNLSQVKRHILQATSFLGRIKPRIRLIQRQRKTTLTPTNPRSSIQQTCRVGRTRVNEDRPNRPSVHRRRDDSTDIDFGDAVAELEDKIVAVHPSTDDCVILELIYSLRGNATYCSHIASFLDVRRANGERTIAIVSTVDVVDLEDSVRNHVDVLVRSFDREGAITQIRDDDRVTVAEQIENGLRRRHCRSSSFVTVQHLLNGRNFHWIHVTSVNDDVSSGTKTLYL